MLRPRISAFAQRLILRTAWFEELQISIVLGDLELSPSDRRCQTSATSYQLKTDGHGRRTDLGCRPRTVA